ncbi:hypothetical protein GOQ30_12035 [Flavobacterium sp. TP390]|uniref:Uncharacterized protein n=1 Tax=Flavobacterium profundi TaxID=1774945 RepID=A0A6I4IMA6_9FLAO|nr:hypothetical protein [Flavobacterium profundi]MVO09891.1 hypothetical protein [Flavobacterium profundi]
MIDIIKLVENNKIFDLNNFAVITFNNFYSRKYGSLEEAEKVFNQLRLECKSEEEFIEKKERKIQSDIPVEQFEMAIKYLQSFQSFSSVVDRENLENQLLSDVQNNPAAWKLVYEIFEDYSYLMNEKYGFNKKLIKEQLILEFNKKITFTIKETREELGFQNQRTFKKWLNYFYGSKYDNNRKFNLLEYIDVIKKFFLKPDELTLDLNKNLAEYKNRLSNGIVVKKSHLIKLTKNDYKLLKNEIDDLKDTQVLNLPDNVDFYPFSIAQLIIQNLE